MKISLKILTPLFSAFAALAFIATPFAPTLNAAYGLETKVAATLAFASEDSIWKCAEQIGSELNCAEVVRVLRPNIENSMKYLGAVDPSKQFGIALAVNENEVYPFGYIPLKSTETSDASALEELKATIAKVPKVGEVEQVIKGSTLYICSPKFKDSLPTDKVMELAPREGETLLLAFEAFPTTIPAEFLEACFAVFRQKIAEQATKPNSVSVENLNSLMNHYSSIVNSMEKVGFSIYVDSSNSLCLRCTTQAKPDTEFAKLLQDTKATQTHWNGIADTSNAIFSCVNAGKYMESLKSFQLDQLQNVACKNALNQLDVLIDDPKDFELAKEAIENLKAEAVAGLERGAFDNAIALGAAPLVLKLGVMIANPDGVKKILEVVVERLKKDVENLDKFVTLNAETIDGYDVTKVDIPVTEIVPKPFEYFKGKTLSARIGIGGETLAIVVGLDSSEVETEFAKVVSGSKGLQTCPTKTTFDVQQLAKVFRDIYSQLDNVRPEALASVNKVVETDNLKVIAEQSYGDNTYEGTLTIGGAFFKAIGNVIRINVQGVPDENDANDMDELFE